MKVLGINGSPRKNWNTGMLVAKALEGAASKGADTEIIHLYDLKYTGCTSCFACKRVGGKSFGKCAVSDELQPVLRKIEECDALVIGSPIYFGEVTGETRSLLERLFFQYLTYEKERKVLTPKMIPNCFMYTMNVSEQYLGRTGYDEKFNQNQNLFNRLLGPSEHIAVTETLQFDDYSKYAASMINEEDRIRRRKDEFPKDLEKAFEVGVRFASNEPLLPLAK